jgi:hypothetical protein
MQAPRKKIISEVWKESKSIIAECLYGEWASTSGRVKGRMRPKLMTVTTSRRKTKASMRSENQRGPVHHATKFRIGYRRNAGQCRPLRVRSIHNNSFSKFTASSGSRVPRTRCISGCTRSFDRRSCQFENTKFRVNVLSMSKLLFET